MDNKKRFLYASLIGGTLLLTAVSVSAYVVWNQNKSTNKSDSDSSNETSSPPYIASKHSISTSPEDNASYATHHAVDGSSAGINYQGVDWNSSSPSSPLSSSPTTFITPSYTPVSNSGAPSSNGQFFPVSFNALGAAGPLFSGGGGGGGGGGSSTNNVTSGDTSTSGGTVSSTPEPETYVMMLIGTGLVFLTSRKKKTLAYC